MARLNNGGIIGKQISTPSASSASGKWNISEVHIYKNNNSWLFPADTGNGQGYSIAQGADGTNVMGHTNTSMTYYASSFILSAGAASPNPPLNYACTGNSANFSFHTGHTIPTYWPFYFAVNVSSSDTGKVLNQMNWLCHTNSAGNVDFFGSNLNITSGNFSTESNYTHLGRAHAGGTGSGSTDCTARTLNFNSNLYGYKWYMFKVVDYNSTALAYPNVGSQGGWAMYGLRLNKV